MNKRETHHEGAKITKGNLGLFFVHFVSSW